MENTIENKAKFFAQYWGQEVFFVPNLIWTGNPPEPSHEEWGEAIVNEYWMPKILNSTFPMFLKSLLDISDDEAIEVAKLEYVGDKYFKVETGKTSVYLLHCFINGEYSTQNWRTVDYLRSKGYALPWMGLSVEQQIEYGWVTLTNPKQ